MTGLDPDPLTVPHEEEDHGGWLLRLIFAYALTGAVVGLVLGFVIGRLTA